MEVPETSEMLSISTDIEYIFQNEIKSQVELAQRIESSLKQTRLVSEEIHLKVHINLLEMLFNSLEKLKDNKVFHLNFQTNQVCNNNSFQQEWNILKRNKS
jgi:hypothetical protein